VTEPGTLEMADLTSQDRLQPSLLDRLTDEDPHVRQEVRERRLISKRQLREAVLRDLAWLFNCSQLESGVDLSATPLVRNSVLNYGLPGWSGRSASSMDISELERSIRQAIVNFEPRILASTLRVRAVVEGDTLDHHNVIGIEIQGQLWAQPTPLELLMRTDIDLESGHVEITDVGGTRTV
jgi:type VI secretion system protein ImpF